MSGRSSLLGSWHYGVSITTVLEETEPTICDTVAVLFLEFWKRRQFQLQYEWDTLGYEAAEVTTPTSGVPHSHIYTAPPVGTGTTGVCSGHQEEDKELPS